MSYSDFDGTFGPFLFILLAGVLPTAMWRWVGVGAVAGIREDSAMFVLVRCMAAGFVAVVISQFVFLPTGALATLPLVWRTGALAVGFVAFLVSRQRILAGVLAGEAVLIAGLLVAV